jgi:RNA polymerase sigma factor (sigma-70 family)
MNTPETSDEISQVQAAVLDRRAFAPLYDRYYRRVYNYLSYRCGEDAEDVTAQVFLKALHKIQTYDAERAPFSAWLFSIARNEANARLRRLRLRRFFPLDWTNNLADPQPDPERMALALETEAELLAAIQKLNHRERDVLGLRFAALLTNRQIADLTGLHESHVGVILFRTVRKLRHALNPEDVRDEPARASRSI